MDSAFPFYFHLGVRHILDWQAYDHLLFLVALCSPFLQGRWKPMVWLITAFTAGHSASLILSAAGYWHADQSWVEWLIPCTLTGTSTYNLATHYRQLSASLTPPYLLTTLFGLVHGLGFAAYFHASMMPGENFLLPLLSFNLGVEFGQLAWVTILVLAVAGIGRLSPGFRKWEFPALNMIVWVLSVFLVVRNFPL